MSRTAILLSARNVGWMMNKVIFGFDPGTTYTGFVVTEVHGNELKVVTAMDIENIALYEVLKSEILNYRHIGLDIEWVLEYMQSYGMRVGESTFMTCVWIGEIRRQAKDNNIPCYFYTRPDWAPHMTGCNNKKDKDVEIALRMRYGDAAFQKGTKGSKKVPGKVAGKYSLLSSSHKRSAFGVIFYHWDMGSAANNKNIEAKND